MPEDFHALRQDHSLREQAVSAACLLSSPGSRASLLIIAAHWRCAISSPKDEARSGRWHPIPLGFLAELDALVAQRHAERPTGSYTTKLFEGGMRRIAQKVGEEGVETALAAVMQNDAELLGEAADLVFHLTVALRARGLSLGDVASVLADRHAPHREM